MFAGQLFINNNKIEVMEQHSLLKGMDNHFQPSGKIRTLYFQISELERFGFLLFLNNRFWLGNLYQFGVGESDSKCNLLTIKLSEWVDFVLIKVH